MRIWLRRLISSAMAFFVATEAPPAGAQSASSTTRQANAGQGLLPDAKAKIEHFISIVENRSPIASTDELFSNPHIVANEADAVIAFNVIISRQAGSYTSQELDQIERDLHLVELSDQDALGEIKIAGMMQVALSLSPDISATRQLVKLFEPYLSAQDIIYESTTIIDLCGNIRRLGYFDYQCWPSSDTPAIPSSTTIPLEFTLAKMSNYAYEIGTRDYDRNPTIDGYVSSGIVYGTYGFAALIFTKGNRVIIAYRGTDPNLMKELIKNISADRSFVFSENAEMDAQIEQAIKVLIDLHASHPNAEFYITGHSLGGALAELVAATAKLPAATFNAPGAGALIFPHVLEMLNSLTSVSFRNSGQIENYFTEGDRISLIGFHFGSLCTIAQPGSIDWYTSLLANHSMDLMVDDIQRPNLARYPSLVHPGTPLPTSGTCAEFH